MRLVSFESPFGPRLGAVVADRVVDLNASYAAYLREAGHERNAVARAGVELPPDATGFLELGAAAMERAQIAIDYALANGGLHLVLPLASLRLLPPVPNPPKIICLGLNYRDHAAEANLSLPSHPPLFAKYSSSLIGSGEPIRIPRVSDRVDYEAELVIVVGRRGRYVSEQAAMEYVAGYTMMNDVSVRDYQMHTSQWTAGKIFHRSTPLGPMLVTADEVPDPHCLEIELVLNGVTLQRSNTAQMVFKVPHILAYVSQICELEPGDLIATGTPAGVGFTRKPPIFLKPGDTVTVRISGLGELTNPVASES